MAAGSITPTTEGALRAPLRRWTRTAGPEDKLDDYLATAREAAGIWREHRDRVNAEVMEDPRFKEMMTPDAVSVDGRRMIFGGFSVAVEE